ncbi:MAG TPA: radical SAM protein [Candidatus Nanoarchaeia archaeon]|nr:radical SAM protein [Candidatus Nanoarchaeia archaeon]
MKNRTEVENNKLETNKVLLIFASEKNSAPRFPLALLALGAYLKKHKFEPEILDMQKEDSDYRNVNFNDYICIGISSMTGQPLKKALEVAKYIKERSSVPLVWGGPHASFFPEQTIKNRYVDIVVKKEAEESLLDIVRTLKAGRSLKDVKGITYKENGVVITNPERSTFIDPSELETGYELVDVNDYVEDTGGTFSYETSRGCPYRCDFCYVSFYHRLTWRGKSSEKVLSDLKNIVERYNPQHIKFVEDNFFVGRERNIKILKGIIKNGWKFSWDSACRADYLCSFTDEEMKLLKDSGCAYLSIGGESGSDITLAKMHKENTVDEVREAVKKCVKFGIMPVLSFMVGLPDETKREMHKTLDFIDEIMSYGNKVEVNVVGIYYPYPGTTLYRKAIDFGFKPANSLEEWSEWDGSFNRNNPWLKNGYDKELEALSTIARFRYFIHRLNFYSKKYKKTRLGSLQNRILYKVFVPLFNLSANFRWKHRLFKYSYEWDLYNLVRNYKFKQL